MIQDLKTITQDWTDEIQSMPKDNTLPMDVYVKIGLDQYFADYGYHTRYDRFSSAFGLYWSPAMQKTIDVYQMQFWADDHAHFNAWSLHRFMNGDVAIAPSKSVYDLGVALGNRPKSYIESNDDDRKGLSETFDYLITKGIAVMLGNFK